MSIETLYLQYWSILSFHIFLKILRFTLINCCILFGYRYGICTNLNFLVIFFNISNNLISFSLNSLFIFDRINLYYITFILFFSMIFFVFVFLKLFSFKTTFNFFLYLTLLLFMFLESYRFLLMKFLSFLNISY